MALVLAAAIVSGPARAQERVVEGRIIYADAADVTSKEDAEKLVSSVRRAGFNVLVLQVKGPDGKLYFTSGKGLAARAPILATFDPLMAVLTEAKKVGLTVHAGICCFLESPSTPFVSRKKEYACQDIRGKTTAEAEKSPGIWMCPARRPGYADEYLIPLIEELLDGYPVDGIHLDHLSFPGEVSPDSYCFCDYCILEFPRHSRLFYPAIPGGRFESPKYRPDPLAHWPYGATALPEGYEKPDPKLMGEYMLEGSYIKRGPRDMRYFFYTYRTDKVREFCAELFDKARATAPKVEFSARVYWDAPAAGRFAGQRWTEFGQWFDFLVLDMGRDAIPGDFDTYRKLLADVAFYAAQKSRNVAHIYACLEVDDIYREQREALDKMVEIIKELQGNPGTDPALPATRLGVEFAKIKNGLAAADETLASDLETSVETLAEVARAAERPGEVFSRIGAKLESLRKKPPAGFYRPGQLLLLFNGLRGAGAESVALDNLGALKKLELLDSIPSVLGPPGREPYKVRPLRAPSAQLVRLFLEKQEQLASASAEIEILNRRLEKLNGLIEPLRLRVEDYELNEQDKLKKLDSLIVELDAMRQDYDGKISELQKMRKSVDEGDIPTITSPEQPAPNLDPPADDLDYDTLRIRLEEKIEELKIAIGQRERAEEIAMQMRVGLEKAHDDLMEQKQSYLYYISILIALACIGLAVILVVQIIRHRQ